MLLKQASGVHVGGTVDVVVIELVVNVDGVVEVLVVIGVDDVLGVLVTGGDTQIVPPQVVLTSGEVTHALPVVPLTMDVVQVVMLLVIAEQVVIGGVQLVVGGGLTQIELAQVMVVTGVVAHTVDDPLLLQLVLAYVVVEHVVIGEVQIDEDVVDALEVVGVVLANELEVVDVEVVVVVVGMEAVIGVVDAEVVTGGLTQIVLAHIVVVSGEVTHGDEAPMVVAPQLVELPVVVTEQVVIGKVQLKTGEVVLGGGLTQNVLAQALVVTGTIAQDVELSLMALQLVVLVTPVEQVVMPEAQLVAGVVALIITGGVVVVLVYGAEVRDKVVVDVITVVPPVHTLHGTVNVVI